MAESTTIQWSQATWNVVTGCSVVSPGCTPNCYAMRLAGTRLKNHPSRIGLTIPTKTGPVWTGEVRFNETWLDQPLRWKRSRMIFVCAHSDLFHENVPDEWLDRIFAVIALAPQHTFQILTKRPERMRAYLSNEATYQRILRAAEPVRAMRPHLGSIPISDPRHGAFWPHVWHGTSVESQDWADKRIPELLATPSAVHWVSYEPALEGVDFHDLVCRETGSSTACPICLGGLEWIVVGGESAQNKPARAFDLAWARKVIAQCRRAGIAPFVKQLGGNVIDTSSEPHRLISYRDKHGGDITEWPEDLRVREFPHVAESRT